jgi:hypothetical protein
MTLEYVISSRKTDENIPSLDDTTEDGSRPSQHSEENTATNPSVPHGYSQEQGNEGEHTFTEPPQTNQKTNIGKKCPAL